MTKDEKALARAMDSLEGLSCGDAFGENFFGMGRFHESVHGRQLPPGVWRVTDDTVMAVSIVETLRVYGEIVEERLADHFVRLYDLSRGYGPAMHGLLGRLAQRGGTAWRGEAASLFGGRGSFGNGSAMRVAPLGAYFADDLDRVGHEATRSAHTTHANPEAAAGAIAVALAAAFAVRSRRQAIPPPREFLESIADRLPDSVVKAGVLKAIDLPADTHAVVAGALLGNGAQVTAMDTVPFALWCAAQSLSDFEDAMWHTVSAGGDMDTTCAIVGGIVGSRVGASGIPESWLKRRETLWQFFATPTP